tara:strand:+ start:7059 stop:7982 length:924 start_codon:yes stop_codon:yes gene_type:complete
MKTELEKKIYQAQCIGNVEPIEYMIPYPSMRSLIEGQNIKFSEQIIFNNPRITNLQFYQKIQQIAHWLDSLGFQPKERIILSELGFPQTEIALFGIWHFGAVAVLPGDESVTEVKMKTGTENMIPENIDLFDTIDKFPTEFDPKYKPLLDDEALVTFEKAIGIRLSHYNLLVNTNSIQKAISLKSRTLFYCTLEEKTSSWVVLKAILPIYCGCIVDQDNPEFTIGKSGCTFNIRTDLKNHNQFLENELAICPENAAVLSINQSPVHLTEYHINENEIKLHGHSVMMGYLDHVMNKKQFRDGGFFLNI